MTREPTADVRERAVATLELFAAWGHGSTFAHLSENLLGGPVAEDTLREALSDAPVVEVRGDVLAPRGRPDLLIKTVRRRRAHAALEPPYMAVAREFTRDLVRHCPFLQAVALTGSLGSGGFDRGDDIDFNLFVEGGTKYVSYLVAVLLGLKYAWRFRHREVDPVHDTPLLPKITCVNVVWPEEQTAPFVRQDAAMAWELARSRPLYGGDRFRQVLADNPWLGAYFPQALHPSQGNEVSAPPSGVARLLATLARRPGGRRLLERASRAVSWLLYHFVQWTRRKNPEARERIEFLRRVKHPYEVFQD